mgnify:CR=1 FL=1
MPGPLRQPGALRQPRRSRPANCRLSACHAPHAQVPGSLHTVLSASVAGFLLVDQLLRAPALVEPLQDAVAAPGGLLARGVSSLLEAPVAGARYGYGLSEATSLGLMWSALVVLLVVSARARVRVRVCVHVRVWGCVGVCVGVGVGGWVGVHVVCVLCVYLWRGKDTWVYMGAMPATGVS